MSDGLTLNIQGGSAVVQGLADAEKQIQQAVQQLLEKHGQGTLDDSQAVAPVLTGEMRDSGHVDVATNQVSVTYDADYSLWVEIGHHTKDGSFVTGQPFLGPAFQDHASQLQDDIKNI